jgi:hypothetical protein
LTSYTFIAEKLFVPDYEYMTRDYVAPKIELALEIPMKKVFDQIFVKAAFESYCAEESSNRSIFSINTGVTF